MSSVPFATVNPATIKAIPATSRMMRSITLHLLLTFMFSSSSFYYLDEGVPKKIHPNKELSYVMHISCSPGNSLHT
jgi:hypothetical protein